MLISCDENVIIKLCHHDRDSVFHEKLIVAVVENPSETARLNGTPELPCKSHTAWMFSPQSVTSAVLKVHHAFTEKCLNFLAEIRKYSEIESS